jgi:hypothetical protein
MRIVLVSLAAAVLAAAAQSSFGQAVLAQQSCAGQYQGAAGVMPLQGTVTLERWSHERTFRHYGQFQDAMGQVHEFEVFSGGEGGVGSVWTNGARHRESRIQLSVVQGGYVIQIEDGSVAQLQCQ